MCHAFFTIIEIKWCPSWSSLYLQILTMILSFTITPLNNQLMTFVATLSPMSSQVNLKFSTQAKISSLKKNPHIKIDLIAIVFQHLGWISTHIGRGTTKNISKSILKFYFLNKYCKVSPAQSKSGSLSFKSHILLGFIWPSSLKKVVKGTKVSASWFTLVWFILAGAHFPYELLLFMKIPYLGSFS
jgi:hypothetical protein